MLNEPSAEELRAFYATYPVHEERSPITRRRFEELLDRFEPHRSTGRLIDVGCGAGFFLECAKERGWEVHGTEYGDRAVATCRARGIDIREGPLDPLVYEPGSFDVVCSFEVMEHLARPLDEMRRMLTLLRPGGLLYVTTPNFRSVGHFLAGASWNVVNPPEHLTYFTPRTLRRAARQLGLRTRWLHTTGVSIARVTASRESDPAASKALRGRDEQVRRRIEARWYLRLAKQLANSLLNTLRIGDSMKAAFEKPRQ